MADDLSWKKQQVDRFAEDFALVVILLGIAVFLLGFGR
jgi:hypothetical protein